MSGSFIHCLFVTRSDTAGGLESVRFIEPKTYRLDRLVSNPVLSLLDALTQPDASGKQVVSSPLHGWTRLKERLARDLFIDGVVLPMQMTVAFKAVESLGALTVGEYERWGGLPGIEGAYVERNVLAVARLSVLTTAQVRSLLASLIDTRSRPLKALPLSASSLREQIQNGTSGLADPDKSLEIALDILEQRQIVRKRVDPISSEDVWLLDHDYLCRGVIAADRRANRWRSLVEERARQYADAGSNIWQRSKALLRPDQQIALLYQRWFRGFRYGKYRAFAALSAFSFLPYMILLVLVAFGLYSEMGLRAQADARAILAVIGQSESSGSEYPSANEVAALRRLAASSVRVRRSFLAQTVTDVDAARRVYRKLDMVLAAAIGLDREGIERQYLVRQILRPAVKTSNSREIVNLCVAFWSRLPDADPEFRQLAAKRFPQVVMQDLGDHVNVMGYGVKVWESAPQLASKLDVNDVNEAIRSAAEYMVADYDMNNGFRGLPELLRLTAGRLDPEGARAVAEILIAAMQEPVRTSDLRDLAAGLTALGDKLDSSEFQKAAEIFVAGANKAKAYGDLKDFVDGFVTVADKVDPRCSDEVSDKLIEWIRAMLIQADSNSIADSMMKDLVELLGHVGKKLDDVHSQKAAAIIVRIMERGPQEESDASLILDSLSTVLKRAGPAYQRESADILLAHLRKLSRQNQRFAPKHVGELVASLDSKLQRNAIDLMLAAIRNTSSSDVHQSMTQALSTISDQTKFDDGSVGQAVEVLRADVQHVLKGYLNSIDNERKTSAKPTSHGDVLVRRDENLNKEVSFLMFAAGRPDLASLLDQIRSLEAKAEIKASASPVPMLIKATEETTNTFDVPYLAKAPNAATDDSNAADVQRTAEVLLTKMEKASSGDELDLVDAAGSLSKWMSKRQLVRLLRSPLCIGPLRTAALQELEQQTKQGFHDNLWEFVDWVYSAKLDGAFGMK